ncbi:MAG: hypothetical protein DSY91_00780 [Deltaproteobacteria bacterium]|nr:MAG: hypothetical protein DSY91_00780 [Deltaproteobacteria bacterium]
MDVWRVIPLRISLFFLCFWLAGCLTVEAGPYWRSAHGNYSTGVKRSSRTLYNTGNCGHCHDQHGTYNGISNGGPFAFGLFANSFNTNASPGNYQKADSFCFACHTSSTESEQQGGITNEDYSKTFGGYSSSGKNDILNTFNQRSYHNLEDIYNYAKDNLSFFSPESSPCVACHNPHIAKRVKADSGNPAVNTAVSLPSAHDSLWGDGNNATDKETQYYFYQGRYQAPYAYGGTSRYEPGSTTTYDGTNLPDYATFCTECHNPNITLYSSTLGRNLIKIDWTTQGGESGPGDKHGRNSATTSLSIKAPFNGAPIGITMGFALSCTDCHEPHGAPNPYLIRSEVNGTQVSVPTTNSGNEIGYLCLACHKDDQAYGTSGTPNKWQQVHHYADDRPYQPRQCGRCHTSGMGGSPIPCMNCHMHGKDDSYLGSSSTGRICF